VQQFTGKEREKWFCYSNAIYYVKATLMWITPQIAYEIFLYHVISSCLVTFTIFNLWFRIL